MWKPNWACTTCGMLSSRRYSVKRHIMNLHGGNGLEVPYVDYMEGRLTGIYKQNYSKQQQQQSSPKYSTYFDTLYGSNRRVNTSSFFSSSSFPYSPYSNPFVMPYRRPSFSNFYSDQSYKGMKPSSSSSASATPPPQDLLSQMTTEFSLEFAREWARKTVSATTTTTTTTTATPPQSYMQSSVIQGGLGYNSILGVQHKQQQEEDVFGYRFVICKDCLYTEPLQVRFGDDVTKDNNSSSSSNSSNNNNSNNSNNGAVDVVGRREQKHACDPILIASNRKEVLDMEGSVKIMVDKLPETASRVTKRWIENQNKRISLIAIKIPHKNNNDNIADNAADNNNNIQPEQETIRILNPKNAKQHITFQYSEEKHINLSLISNESSKNHYAARAIKYGHTILTNDEMEDFLNMAQTSTFAIFKIRTSSPTTTTATSLPLQQQNESIGLFSGNYSL